ncbi:MAG: hypothetical protein QOD67_2229 [Caballeronia sp.]|nr:hypothetical protein [Caballeronia sp.]
MLRSFDVQASIHVLARNAGKTCGGALNADVILAQKFQSSFNPLRPIYAYSAGSGAGEPVWTYCQDATHACIFVSGGITGAGYSDTAKTGVL